MVLVVRLVHLICFLDLIEMDNDQVINLDDRIVDDLRNCLICQKSDVKDLNISLKLVANLGKFRDGKVLGETIKKKKSVGSTACRVIEDKINGNEL